MDIFNGSTIHLKLSDILRLLKKKRNAMKTDHKILLDDSMLDDVANIILSLGHKHISNILDELKKKQEQQEKEYFEIRKTLEDQKESELNKLEDAFVEDQN